MQSLRKLSSITKIALVASSTLFFVACSSSKKENYEMNKGGASEQNETVASSPTRMNRSQDKKDSKNNANYDYAVSEEEYYSTDDQISQNTEEYQKQIENKFIQSLNCRV